SAWTGPRRRPQSWGPWTAEQHCRRSDCEAFAMIQRPWRRTSSPGSFDAKIILVDESNRAVGTAGKHAVHRAAMLHRALSIFVVDGGGRLLLQQRNPKKYR